MMRWCANVLGSFTSAVAWVELVSKRNLVKSELTDRIQCRYLHLVESL